MKDLERSRDAYKTLLQAAKSYRHALASISISAGNLGSALEVCARLKEARNEVLQDVSANNGHNIWHEESAILGDEKNCTGGTLLAASGVHQLIANRHQILSDTIYQKFEVPLMQEFDQWQRRVEEEEVKYQREAKTIVKEIRSIEKNGMKLRKSQKKDLNHFREQLAQLTQQIDTLTDLGSDHGRAIGKNCHKISRAILEFNASVVKAEVEAYDTLARKGLSETGLGKLMEKVHEHIFSEDERGERRDKLSSNLHYHSAGAFLQQESKLPDTNQHKINGYRDKLMLETMGCQSGVAEAGENEFISIFSERRKSVESSSNYTQTPRLNSSTVAEVAKITNGLLDDPGQDKMKLMIRMRNVNETSPDAIHELNTRKIGKSEEGSVLITHDEDHLINQKSTTSA